MQIHFNCRSKYVRLRNFPALVFFWNGVISVFHIPFSLLMLMLLPEVSEDLTWAVIVTYLSTFASSLSRGQTFLTLVIGGGVTRERAREGCHYSLDWTTGLGIRVVHCACSNNFYSTFTAEQFTGSGADSTSPCWDNRSCVSAAPAQQYITRSSMPSQTPWTSPTQRAGSQNNLGTFTRNKSLLLFVGTIFYCVRPVS